MPPTPSPAFAWTLNGNVKETISAKPPAQTNPSTPAYAPAQYGQLGLYQTSMRYNGVTPPLPLLPLSDGVTIALWLYYTNPSPPVKFFSISSFSATTNATDPGKISCDYLTGSYLSFSFNAQTGTKSQQFQSNLPNSWNHYVISFGGGDTNILFYLNGVQAGTLPVPSSWGTSSDPNSYRFGGNVGLGCTESATASVTGMTFSDWRFYNTVLTPVQIQSIYQSGGYYLASQMSMTGAPLLKLLSAQAQSSATGIFSLRAVSGVTARAVQVVPSGIFPPGLMTGNFDTDSSTQTLGSGGLFAGSYTASSSTHAYSHGAPKAFAGPYVLGSILWQVSDYPAPTGTALPLASPTATQTTTTSSGPIYYGDWLQLQTPFPVIVSGYSFTAGGGFSTFVSLGSTTGNNGSWTLIDSTNSTNVTGLNIPAYTYFRFVILTSFNIFPWIANVQLTGAVPSLVQDFYADRVGNLLTAPVTGQSLSRWLGGATGSVATWYDQSGKGNHATQTTQGNRPSITLDASNRYQVNFTANGGSCWMNLPTGTIPMQTAYTVTCHHNTIGNAKGGICGARGAGGNGTANRFRRSDTTTGYINYWWNIDVTTPTGYAPGNVVTFKFAAETSPTSGTTYVYTNGSQIYYLSRSGWVGVGGSEVIGATDPFADSENMNGQMYSLFLFTSALSDSDRTAVENAS